MPQRFLRPGITTSEKWNRAGWKAQSMYIRLLTIVDDYGRCDGRASVIHGQCVSVWNEQNPDNLIDFKEVSSLLDELADVGLVEIYDVEGKKVLQVTQWQERIREGVREKWPAKPQLQQVAASCSKLQRSSTSVPTSTSTSAPPSPTPVSIKGNGRFEEVKMTKNGVHTLDLLERCKKAFGEDEMKRCHRRWYTRATKDPDRLDRILADTEEFKKSGGKAIKSYAARAEDMWEQFK